MSNTIEHHAHPTTDIFGFWIYILSDCVLFAVIFATFAVLHENVFGGLPLKALIDLHDVFAETMLLLASSFTYGMAIISLYQRKKHYVFAALVATACLGGGFVAMELSEFIHLYLTGHSWQSNGALSAFFTLVGTHGLHVMIGLLWMSVLMIQLFWLGLTPVLTRRLTYLGLFWAFLDIVWIFVFTIVYLMEAI